MGTGFYTGATVDKLKIDVSQTDQAIVAALVGDAGAPNAAILDMAVSRLCAMRPRAVVLDLTKLSFIASLSMGSLVALRRAVTAHGGTVRIAGATDAVGLTLRRASLHLIFPFDASVSESLEAAGAS